MKSDISRSKLAGSDKTFNLCPPSTIRIGRLWPEPTGIRVKGFELIGAKQPLEKGGGGETSSAGFPPPRTPVVR